MDCEGELHCWIVFCTLGYLLTLSTSGIIGIEWKRSDRVVFSSRIVGRIVVRIVWYT